MPDIYPLTWPDGMPRTERREYSRFKTSLAAALKNVQGSLKLFGADSGKPVADIVLSSNVAGLSSRAPADPGVAAWFTWDGAQRCIAVDRYPKVEDNLQAIYHVIEARRTEMRHGGLHIVRQTFKGFVALPAPDGQKTWREVFGFGDSLVAMGDVETRFKTLSATAHPDRGGSNQKMADLNRARAEAKAALS
jgi:hypothetical protein